MEKTAVPKAMTQQHRNWTLEVFEAYNAAYKFYFKKTISARPEYMQILKENSAIIESLRKGQKAKKRSKKPKQARASTPRLKSSKASSANCILSPRRSATNAIFSNSSVASDGESRIEDEEEKFATRLHHPAGVTIKLLNDVLGKDTDEKRDFDDRLKLGAYKQFFNLLPQLGEDEPTVQLSAEIIVRGLADLPFEKFGHLQEVYLGKLIGSDFSAIVQAFLNNPKLEPLSHMTSFERVSMIFTDIKKTGFQTSRSQRSHLVSLYLKESALVLPTQVKMLAPFEDTAFRLFGKEVFENMFMEGVLYVDTQLACLLVVGCASQLGDRLKIKNPHKDFKNWKDYKNKFPASRRKDKGHPELSHQMWSAFVTVFSNFDVTVVQLVMQNMPVLCDSIVLETLGQQSQICQIHNAAILAYCCNPGHSVATLLDQIEIFKVSVDIKVALSERGRALQGEMIRLIATDLIRLLSHLGQLELDDACERIKQCKDLNVLLSEVKAVVAAYVEADQQEYDSAVDELLGNDAKLRATYGEIVNLSKIIEEEEGRYRHNIVQCAMATLMFEQLKPRFGVFVAPPGQGKTFVMLLFARYILLKQTTKTVYMYTPNAIVAEQMSKMLGGYQPDDGDTELIFRSGTNFHHDAQASQDAVFILDEGDQYIKRHSIEFSELVPSGLNSLRNHQVYMVTATLDELSTRLIKEVFNPKGKYQVEVDSINKLTGGGADFDITGKVCKTDAQMEEAIVRAIGTRPLDQPVLLFERGKIQQTQTAIAFLESRLHKPCVRVFQMREALQMQGSAAGFQDGLFVLSAALGRGFDMPFKKTAFVVVVDSTGTIGESMAKQMIGRSSRKFGTQVGHVITKSNVMGDSVDIMRVLETQDSVNQSSVGDKVAKAILSAWDSKPSEQLKSEIAAFCQENKWHYRASAFLQAPMSKELCALFRTQFR